jgi:hypothetical protein
VRIVVYIEEENGEGGSYGNEESSRARAATGNRNTDVETHHGTVSTFLVTWEC